MGCGIIINLYESIKKIISGGENSNSLKLDKDAGRSFFLKDVNLGELGSDYLNELISILVGWYRVRMPDNVFVKKGSDFLIDTHNVNYSNYKKMSFEQLLKRNSDLNLLKCKYRNDRIYSIGELSLKIYTVTGLFNNKEDKVCNIFIDRESGRITHIEGDNLLPNKIIDNYSNYTLHELLDLLSKGNVENLNYDSLIECAANRKNDLDARDKIIDTVCLELINSDDNDYGYYRALTFLKEIANFLELKFNSSYFNNFVEKIYSANKVEKKEKHKVKSRNIQH